MKPMLINECWSLWCSPYVWWLSIRTTCLGHSNFATVDTTKMWLMRRCNWCLQSRHYSKVHHWIVNVSDIIYRYCKMYVGWYKMSWTWKLVVAHVLKMWCERWAVSGEQISWVENQHLKLHLTKIRTPMTVDFAHISSLILKLWGRYLWSAQFLGPKNFLKLPTRPYGRGKIQCGWEDGGPMGRGLGSKAY